MTAQRTGYSGKPLYLKLGIKAEHNLLIEQEPTSYQEWLELPFTRTPARLEQPFDFIHIFSEEKEDLRKSLATYRSAIAQNGMIWVSWPKKASKVPTTVTEDTARELAFPLVLVDVKVCSVSPIWSGLKLMIRKELRT